MDPVSPSPTDKVHSESLDRELLTFLREESRANRDTLREDSEANRKALLGTLRIVSYPLAAVIAIAGILGWRSVSDLKKTIQAEATRETTSEIQRMQKEIRNTLSAQFETPQLQKMVKEAASNQTQAVLRPLIVKEVGVDVSRSVNAEQHTIKSAMLSETQKAVENLKPAIDSIVVSRVNATVDKSVDSQINTKVTPVLNSLQKKQELADLLSRAQTDDGAAFDRLWELTYLSGTDPETAQRAAQAIRDIIKQHSSASYAGRVFRDPTTEDQLLAFLRDNDPGKRQAAMDHLSEQNIRKHIDEIFQIMISDPDLNVREAGFRRFNAIRPGANDVRNRIEILDKFSAIQWWSQHRSELLPTEKPK